MNRALAPFAQAARALWALRSRAAQLQRVHKLQVRHLSLFQRWGVIYRSLEAERVRGLPRVDDFEREICVGNSIVYTVRPQTKGSGMDCAVCIRAAYKNRFGEWEPAMFIEGHGATEVAMREGRL